MNTIFTENAKNVDSITRSYYMKYNTHKEQ